MLDMVLKLLAGVADAVGGWFRWKSSGVAQAQSAGEMVDEAEAAARKSRAEVNRIVNEGDADAVNRMLNSPAALLAAAWFAIGGAIGCTTSPSIVYVPADREVRCETNVVGRVLYWKVPPAVMEELLNAKVELGELKRELKVKEITK